MQPQKTEERIDLYYFERQVKTKPAISERRRETGITQYKCNLSNISGRKRCGCPLAELTG